MKDFISLLDYTHQDLVQILDRADALHTLWKQNQMPPALSNHQIGLWFLGQGFRNRLAFEIGARAMGGQVAYIPGDLGVQEPLEDIGYYLENWFTLLVVRAARHEDLVYLAEHTRIPVINARTNFSHPCEIMGDLQFIRRHRGSLDGLKAVFVGEVSNLGMSWFEAAARFPIQVTQVAPEKFLANPSMIAELNSQAMGSISCTTDLESVIADADLVYTDCWPKPNNSITKEQIRVLFLPYQIAENHLSQLKANSLFLPCPPVTRGEEVSAEAMRSPLCQNYAAKEYLLHSQNAIMEMLAGRVS
ncbi:MAG: ornithine carbamoyltransferase [Chloroflexota bacterium]|nr:ornithine carbamoyltransferase [Chloroflexota bacterium]NOG62467.1 ornithine carbamoyltransferase [Chloroflexota bacterium]GIK64160.1 MAG: ornithine carbamoyltransferase [Chloroflexota bacterium]